MRLGTVELVQELAVKAARTFGSDVYERVGTLQYWNANQMAHMMMGFFGTTMTSLACMKHWNMPALGLAFLILPALRDVNDYLNDREAETNGFSEQFVHLREVVRDCLTDTSYWVVGALLAVATVCALQDLHAASSQYLALAVFVGAFAAWNGIGHYWPQKRRFDRSGIPYFVRLAKFRANMRLAEDGSAGTGEATGQPLSLDPAIAGTVCSFLDPDRDTQFLIVCGDGDSGKTSLACGIATEFVIWPKHNTPPRVRYMAMAELLSLIGRNGGRYGFAGVLDDTRPLSASEANVLVIDEAGPLPNSLQQGAGGGLGQDLVSLLKGKMRVALVANQADCAAWKRWIEQNLSSDAPVPVIAIADIVDDESARPPLRLQMFALATYVALAAAGLWWLCAMLYLDNPS